MFAWDTAGHCTVGALMGGGTLFGWDTAHYTTGAQMGGGTLFGWDTQTEEVQDCQLSTALLFDCHLIHFCN